MKEFIKEILEVCERHNKFISHEDYHGGFLIVPAPCDKYKKTLTDWFLKAREESS